MAFQRSKTGTPLGGTASSATARLPGTTTSGRMISRASCAYPSQLCPRPFPVRAPRTGGSSSPRAAELLAVPRTGMMCPSRSAPSRASCPPPTRRSPPRACASSRAMTMCSRTAVPPRNPRFSTPCSSSQIQALAREPACERASCSERTQGSSRGRAAVSVRGRPAELRELSHFVVRQQGTAVLGGCQAEGPLASSRHG